MMKQLRAGHARGYGVTPMLADNTPDAVRNWIRAICRAADITTTQLAREAGFPPATINRFVNKTVGHQRNLNATTLAKIQDASLRLLTPQSAIKDGKEPAAGSSQTWTIRSIEVVGPVGQLASAIEWPSEQKYLWPAPIAKEYQGSHVVGLEVIDDSVDQLYPQGSIVTCVPFADLGRLPLSGERVVVHRRSDSGHFSILIMEYFIDVQHKAWLIARSSLPSMVNIELGDHGSELPDNLTIPYRVAGSFTPE